MTAADRAPKPRRPLGWAIWLLLPAAIIAALVVASGIAPAQIADALHRAPAGLWPGLIALQAGVIVCAAIKWRVLLATTAPALPALGLAPATCATTLGTLAGLGLPIQIVTPAIRAWVARHHGIPAKVALGTSALEQVFEVIALIAFGVVAGLIVWLDLPLTGALIPALIGILAILAGLAATTRPLWRIAAFAASRMAQRSGGRTAATCATLARGFTAAAELRSPVLALLLLLSVGRFVMLTVQTVGILAILLPEAPLEPLILAFPLVLLLTSLPIFPGGLGIAELSWSGMLVATGTPPALAVSAAIALRILATAGLLLAAPLLLAPEALRRSRRREVCA